MSLSPRKLGPAHAARLARIIKRRRASALPLTSAQKTASEPRLSRTCVAQTQQVLTLQENNHARLL